MPKIEELKKKLDKLKERYEEERERVKAYKQIVEIYGAYMAVLLNSLGATKDKPFQMTHVDIAKALETLETRAVPSETGFEMYVEKENKNAK